MAERKARDRDLREACIQEALAIIETAGVEALSLRDISRRLGVSHQAPYKHFPSRDHILAEIVRRAFDSFAAHLDSYHPHTGDPHRDLATMGRTYLDYALTHSLQYRLMFGTPLPDPAQHPAMMKSAQHAFALLQDCLMALRHAQATPSMPADASQATLDALFVWSTLHGLASILPTRALDTLALPSELLTAAPQHTLARIGAAINAPPTDR
jgi:AcrR family transcriptional regulator